ncbi:MAG: hypothetical protein QW228_07075 [Candidatus Aenigmatarchaeota archaeon]
MLRRIPGVGPKKANMITRDFTYRSLGLSQSNPWFDQIKARFPNFRVVDEKLLDMPIDVHVVKVFNRITGRFQGSGKRNFRIISKIFLLFQNSLSQICQQNWIRYSGL